MPLSCPCFFGNGLHTATGRESPPIFAASVQKYPFLEYCPDAASELSRDLKMYHTVSPLLQYKNNQKSLQSVSGLYEHT